MRVNTLLGIKDITPKAQIVRQKLKVVAYRICLVSSVELTLSVSAELFCLLKCNTENIKVCEFIDSVISFLLLKIMYLSFE